MHSYLKVFLALCLLIFLVRQVVASDGSREVRMVVLAVGLSAFAEEGAGLLTVERWKLLEEAHGGHHQY